MRDGLYEKCAVVGVSVNDGSAALLTAECLQRLQHRGEDATGIAYFDNLGQLQIYSGLGKVATAYDPDFLSSIHSDEATGHNRWATSGKGDYRQPLKPYGFGHNGNLSYEDELDMYLAHSRIPTGHANDSGKMSLAIEQEGKRRELPDAIAAAYPMFVGGFACVAMQGDMVVGFRDPNGIRPLSIGELDSGNFVFASETCALKSVGAAYVGDVEPGQMVIAAGGRLEKRQLAEGHNRLDIFEPVYLGHPNSDYYGQSVAQTRLNLGEQLAKEYPPPDADNVIVTAVPDSTTLIAQGYVKALKHSAHPLTLEQVIVRDRYFSGRTFIQAEHEDRRALALRKLTVLGDLIRGNHMVIVDDSIVRGNTQQVMTELMRANGALSVTVLSGSPPVAYSDHYGVATSRQKDLIASSLTIEQMRESSMLIASASCR